MSARVIVTGAASQVGRFLLPKLADKGYAVTAVSRSGADKKQHNVDWLRADMSRPDFAWPDGTALIHLAPLGILLERLDAAGLGAIGRVIAFSSTSVLSKQASGNAVERAMIHQLAAAEAKLQERFTQRGIAWTIFRPTMIYDNRSDKNVMLIRRFIQRFGFFPLIGRASGKRQPVHAEDLAEACCLAFANENTFGRIYNLGGGEVLAYRHMVDRIFSELGKPPRYLPVPAAVFRGGIRLARRLPRFRYLNPEMANRMNQDMAFDGSDAARDFDYRPRRFMPGKVP